MVDHSNEDARSQDSGIKMLEAGGFGGSTFTPVYTERHEAIFAVLERDLKTIKNIDNEGLIFYTIGIFLLSSIWLFIEYLFPTDKPFEMTTLLWVCSACMVFGVFCLGYGIYKQLEKRKFITDIFDKTKVLPQGTRVVRPKEGNDDQINTTKNTIGV